MTASGITASKASTSCRASRPSYSTAPPPVRPPVLFKETHKQVEDIFCFLAINTLSPSRRMADRDSESVWRWYCLEWIMVGPAGSLSAAQPRDMQDTEPGC